MGRDWPRHPVSGESHRETGEGERGTETAATSRGVSRLTWPGLVPRCPAPVSRSSHALCPGPDCPAQLPPCSDPRTRPFQIVQTRATHSVRLSLGPSPPSLSDPTAPDAGLMMGLMASRGRVVTALAPVRTCSGPHWPPVTHGTGLYMLCTVPCTLYCHVTWHTAPSHCLHRHHRPMPDTDCPFPGPPDPV